MHAYIFIATSLPLAVHIGIVGTSTKLNALFWDFISFLFFYTNSNAFYVILLKLIEANLMCRCHEGILEKL